METTKNPPYSPSLANRLFSLSLLVLAVNLRTTIASYKVPEFYYYYEEKIGLNLSTEAIAIRFEDGIGKERQENLIKCDPMLENVLDEKLPHGLVLAATNPGFDTAAVAKALETLNAFAEIKYTTPVFRFRNLKLVLFNQFVVRFKPDVTDADIQALNEQKGAALVRKSPYRRNRYVLRVLNPKARNAIELANLYSENPLVEYATPDFVVIGGYHNLSPDDTYFASQWALNNTGQDPPAGTPDADMDPPEGWGTETGASDIVIAVIDSGVDIDHEDLASKIWTNEVELNGESGVDDDENGYIDDIHGWNFESGTNDPRGTYYHGTACAGLAAADTNNAKGVAGVSWATRVMPLRIGTLGPITSAAADALDYASNNGADVLTNSWGVSPNADLTDAITHAKNNGREGKGCPIIFSSGNYNGPVAYPATLTQTIAVGASDHYDERWDVDSGDGSNFGGELDVVAPTGWGSQAAVIFWTTDITGSAGYNWGSTAMGDAAGNYTKWFGGTSAAAPQVAGLAALILSRNPHLTADQVQSIIESTADDRAQPGWDPYYGWGRINAHRAVLEAASLTFSKDDNLDVNDCLMPGEYVTYTITYANPITDANDPAYLGDVNDINIIDHLPPEIDPFDVNVSGGGAYDMWTNTVTWNIGTLSPGEQNSVTVTVSITADAEPCGVVTNVAVLEGEKCRKLRTKYTPLGCFGPDVIHVDAAATGYKTGTSWLHAYTDLQSALHRARTCDANEIWVAAGTYKPTTDPQDSAATFQLADGVPLYGGFAGNETSRDQRNWLKNQTILTGDIDGDAQHAAHNNTSHYVVTASDINNATIDGFTITMSFLAAIYSSYSSITIQHSLITDNEQDGIKCTDYSNCKIANCVIEYNGSY
ncbi:MAG TPA: S8 family serine peptidase, partial [Sedimentisphaerales bacterium]|nr:S8 family serine peptidase [Sedimentisphaerales bacterium]